MVAISILVPIYNVERYLNQCIDSIINQTFSDLEIILINDGSKDCSLEIIKRYASADARIKIIDKDNSGYGASMNMGLDLATGKYIGIVESDDWIDPCMYECLYNLCESDFLDVARSEFYFYSTKDGEKNVHSNISFVPHDVILSPSSEESVFFQQPSIWANLYRRDFLEKNNIRFLETPGASYQDTSFSFKVYACAKRFKMIHDAFYHYRIDGGSSSFQNTTKVYCVCDEYDEIWRYIKQSGLYDTYRYLVPLLQFNGYKWNFNRLADPYCYEFFERWHSDFTQLNLNRDIDYSRFGGEDASLLNRVLKNISPIKGVPKISVIVPVYNVELYVEKCIMSLINQSFRDLEIICVDDGSTDNSGHIVDKLSKLDSRVVVIHKKNGGLSSARNAGLEVARGEFVAFVDSDDYVEPDTYSKAYSAIHGHDMVIFGTNVFGDAMLNRRESDNEYYRIKYNGSVNLTDSIRLNMDVAAWNKLYRMDIIRSNGILFPIGKLYEDYSFYWKYIFFCNSVFFIEDKCYNYLRRADSIMAKSFDGYVRAIEHLDIFVEVYEYLKNNCIWNSRDGTLVSMFLNCFWFSYLNVPLKYKKKVMRRGTKIVRRFSLSGHPDIDNLRIKKWNLVDPHIKYSNKYRLMKRLFDMFDSATGPYLSSLKQVARGTDLAPMDDSHNIATTHWVNSHEAESGIKQWRVLYDIESPVADLNWGCLEGLSNDAILGEHSLRSIFIPGKEYRVILSLWGVETTVLFGKVLNHHRTIWGTAICDGPSIFAMSIDIDFNTDSMRLHAKSIPDCTDYSEHIRVLKIEVCSQ